MSFHITYCIAGITISIDSNHDIFQTKGFLPFVIESKKSYYCVKIKSIDNLQEIKGKLVVRNNEYMVCYNQNGYRRYYFEHDGEKRVYAFTSWDWKNRSIIVNYMPYGKRFLNQSGNMLYHLGLEMILLREKRLIFHAACIRTEQGGLLFTGSSGAGKSTQADLWVENR